MEFYFQHSSVSSPNSLVVFDNHSTTVEVTVKTKGKKGPTSFATNQSPLNIKKQSPGHGKSIEEKRRSLVNTESHDWSRILREQNQSTLKQSVQKLSGRDTVMKTTHFQPTENREIKRQSGSFKKSHHVRITSSNVPSAHSVVSCAESIIVVDKGVQCGGIFDESSNSFGLLNPVRALGVLMKELEGLIGDKKTRRLLSQMEQALLRIPVEPGTPSPAVNLIFLKKK